MKQVKKIYCYRMVLTKPCKWCDGTGYSVYLAQTCTTCKGTGGKYEKVRYLKSEEVTEMK